MSRWNRVALPLVAIAATCGARPLAGQVVSDGSLGLGGSVPRDQGAYPVGPEYGRRVGGNLFHSLSRLDLGPDETATFSGPPDVGRVLVRVTGGRSTIDGTLRCDIGGAALFLMNPAGVVFRPGALIDVDGAFVVTTADALRLGDGARFTAAPDVAADAVLTTAPPAAFGFAGPTPGAVELRGALLATRAGRDAAVVAGDVTLDAGASLETPGGRASIVSVAGPGDVALAALAPGPLAAPDAGLMPAPGRVELRGGAAVTADEGGRGIVVRAGKLVVADGAALRSRTTDDAPGGSIDLRVTGELELTGSALVSTRAFAGGDAGHIDVSAGSLSLDRGAAISANATGTGRGGDVRVAADGRVRVARDAAILAVARAGGAGGNITLDVAELDIDGELAARLDAGAFADGRTPPTGIIVDATAAGPAGSITVDARAVRIADGGLVSATTLGPSAGGSIAIRAAELLIDGAGIVPFTGVASNTQSVTGGGPGGDVRLGDPARPIRSVRVVDAGAVAANTFGDGPGGTVTIHAGAISIEGGATTTREALTGILVQSRSRGIAGGPGGAIDLRADTLRITERARVSARTLGPGAGGRIAVAAGDVRLESGGEIESSSTGGGAAGSIDVTGARQVRLSAGARVTVSAPDAPGGDIRIVAGERIDLRAAGVTAEAVSGGNVVLAADDRVLLDRGSTLTARAAGDGGSIVMNPDVVVLRDSLLDARAGGLPVNVRIAADVYLNSGSAVLTDTPIDLPDTDIAAGLVRLRPTPSSGAARLVDVCASGLGAAAPRSSFVVVGRGGSPLGPAGAGWIPSFDPAVPGGSAKVPRAMGIEAETGADAKPNARTPRYTPRASHAP